MILRMMKQCQAFVGFGDAHDQPTQVIPLKASTGNQVLHAKLGEGATSPARCESRISIVGVITRQEPPPFSSQIRTNFAGYIA